MNTYLQPLPLTGAARAAEFFKAIALAAIVGAATLFATVATPHSIAIDGSNNVDLLGGPANITTYSTAGSASTLGSGIAGSVLLAVAASGTV